MAALLILLLLVCGSFPAHALESAPVSSPRAAVSLVSDTDAVAAGKPFQVGLYLRLAPGWHSYWKNPGDAGAAANLELTLSPGASAGPIAWPTPRRVAEGSLMTYAYTGDVLLPVVVTPAAGGDGVTVQAHAQWLVCKDICVPEEGDFRLDLPAGEATPSAQAPLFAAAARQVPRPSPWQATIAADGTLWVRGPELTPGRVVDAWFIPDAPGSIVDAAAQPLTVREGGFVLGLRPGRSFKADAGISGVLSVRDRSGQQTDVALRAMPGTVPQASLPLARVLGLALLGGLILNLMPCVFPVLAVKVAGLAGAAHRRTRSHAASYTAGVLVAFTALGGALLLARAAGAAAGWGFQFASPLFVAAMAWLMFALGLNLSGVYGIGGGLTGAGHGLAGRAGHVGSFATGLLAVIVATPCTAPFMGVAIAAGLAAPPATTLLVFLVMGIGLAAPYALLASMPALGRIMPRPGRWMELMRQALAFPMYGASAWLVWVISQESGSSGVLATLASLVLTGFAAWVLGVSQGSADRSRRIGQTTAAAALLAALTVLSSIAASPSAPAAMAETGVEPFSPARLAALRSEGRPVFVNMTAAWCVTCLVNERVALSTDQVRRAFAERGVAYLKGDWTRQDPDITRYLRENGRDGVPLYVYYPPHGAPEVLPQILTEGTVLSELARG